MNTTAPPHLTIPLSNTAHNLGRQFAAQQATPEKGMRVYLNTLAVWAVHRYLKYLQIETELPLGDSWNPGLQALLDVADLLVPNLGKLECRPVLPNETVVALPPEVTQDRIGYLAIQFSDRLQDAQLLGFAPAVGVNPLEELRIAELQPLDTLLDILDQLESSLARVC